ncbi:Clp protease ClpB [Cyclobacterium sediminis]
MKATYFLGFIIWLITLPMEASGQERLKKLIGERAQLHQQWQASESQKSGLFGNRTKKDMTATNEWLIRILNKDNQIIKELEMLKEIETTEIGYEKEDYKFIAQKAEEDIVKLKRALDLKDEKIQSGLKEKRTYEWTTLIFFVSSMVLGFLYYNKRNRQPG